MRKTQLLAFLTAIAGYYCILGASAAAIGDPNADTASGAQKNTAQTSSSTASESTASAATLETTAAKAGNVSACIDFGIAAPYSGFFFQSYQGSSDIQGRIAINGDAVFSNGYSVGDQVKGLAKCEPVVRISGSLTWGSGRSYGGIVVGRDANKVSPIVVDPGCQVELKQNDIDYATAKFQLIALSERLSRLPSTVKSQKIEYQKMMLEMSGSAPIEVVNIDDSNMFMGKVNDFEVPKGVKSDSVLVFNIRGQSTGLVNMNQEALKDLQVIFNFPEATVVQIRGIGVRGVVLAPGADIRDATGVIWGSVFANSMTGPCQINLTPLPQCPQPSEPIAPAAPSGTCISTSVVKCRPRPTSSSESVAPTNYSPSSSADPCISTLVVKCRPRPTSSSESVAPTGYSSSSSESVAPTGYSSATSESVAPTGNSSSTPCTSTSVVKCRPRPTTSSTCTKDSVAPTGYSTSSSESVAPTSTECASCKSTSSEYVPPTSTECSSCRSTSLETVAPTTTECASCKSTSTCAVSSSSEYVAPTSTECTSSKSTSTSTCTERKTASA